MKPDISIRDEIHFAAAPPDVHLSTRKTYEALTL